ncbi:MAG: sialidase family protein, partial [Prevotellamassilia sp.]|nr:sialidase family protein [Prevotellamassilia sp.]
MQYSNGYVAGYSGASGTCTYTLTAPEGCIIEGYAFDFANTTTEAYELNFTANGTSYKSSATKQHVEASGLEERTAQFVQSGANKGLTFTDFTVKVRRSTIKPEPFFVVFETPTTSAIPYRIPAIATAHNGNIIAVADYRHSRSDIGMAHNGRIDLRARISKDNGQTWGDIFDIVRGQGGNSPDFMNVGFGDPCIVADRESGKVLILSCAGNVSFPNGTRNNHQNIARFYSEDNGETWGKPDDIAESIYSQFDQRADGPVRAMFIGSGKIIQSETVKAGTHYRLYCAALVKINDGTYTNFVFYSDDFGGTWKVLGGVDVAPVPSGADEPKVEELPDGSILISSRVNGGRWFNIYNFTNSETAEGYWNTVKQSNSGNNGVVAVSNSTNGEVMVVPVMRKADNKPMYLLLQSVPFGSGRANVGIYYKELASLNDFATTDSIAANWDGRHQSSYMFSAYSTMCLQQDNTIGFLYEEETFCGTGGGGYSIIYKNYSIDYITDSLYTYHADVDRNAIVASNIDNKTTAILENVGPYVGNYLETAGEALNGALEAYKAAPSKQGYEAINAAIANAPRVEVEAGKWYTLRNHGRSNGTLYMTPEDTRFTVATGDAADADQLFSFTATDTEGVYNLYNGNYGLYFGKLGANETQPAVHETPEDAGRYTVIMSASGLSGIACQNKTGGHAGIHLAGDCKRLVPWTTNAEASLWYIQPVEFFNVTIPEAGYTTMNLPFAVSLPEAVEAYAVTGRTVVDDVECLHIKLVEGAVPANHPVIVKATAGNYVFNIVADEEATAVEERSEEFKGTLKAQTLTNNQKTVYTLSTDKFVRKNNSSVAVPANSAYLVSESETDRLPLSTLEGVPVGIEGVNADTTSKNALYDLNGKRVSNPTTGIYVTGKGQKVFIAR